MPPFSVRNAWRGEKRVGMTLEREWQKLLKQEERMLAMAEKKAEKKQAGEKKGFADQIQERIPEKLVATLDAAFYRAFFLIFEKGTGVIEKTFQGEELQLEFEVNDFRVNKKPNKRSLQKLDAAGKKSRALNAAITTAEGVGLGLLGIGIPDIPLFLGMLLKGLYEIASSYGYDYTRREEQIYILRILSAGLAEGGEKREKDKQVDSWVGLAEQGVGRSFEEEVRMAADSLSRGMLMAKFIQGLPLIGVVGGVSNPIFYRKIMSYAVLKYKKRYLAAKRKGV